MPEAAHRPREADLWEPWQGGPAVHCYLCAHHCRIEPGDRGTCGVRENVGGTLRTWTYDCAISGSADPIEKKPLFHFLPGTRSFSIATVGCNFTCLFCQNADISQMPREEGIVRGRSFPPAQVIDEARRQECASIAYTYTEPTIFFEYARDCSRAATEAGIANVFVTNGYMTAEALESMDGLLDAANVDLKSFDDGFYRDLVGARLKPVLDSIRRLHDMGVWLEVTTLLIPGKNDSDQELHDLAAFLASVDPDIPWHVSRFHPTYRMMDVEPTPVSTVERALAAGRDAGLRYVYAGNVPGHDGESTFCPSCGERVIDRRGFRVAGIRLDGDRCARCGHRLALVTDARRNTGKDARGAESPGSAGEGSMP